MIGFATTAAMVVSAFLLTYLIYSTITVACAWLACRLHCMNDAVSRVRAWKLALLLPLALSVAAILVPAPWLPVVRLQRAVAAGQEYDPPDARDRALVRARSQERRGIEMQTVTPPGRDATFVNGDKSASRKSGQPAVSEVWSGALGLTVFVLWPIGALIGLACLSSDFLKLYQVIRLSRPITDGPVYRQLLTLCARMHVRDSVRLFESPRVQSPFAAGWRSPYILLPTDWFEQLTTECREAVLAHELSHISARDAVWNLIVQTVRRTFWFQPLNFVVCRHLRREMEFAADRQAAQMIDDPANLAQSLVQIAERLMFGSQKNATVPTFVAGMSVHRSGLKRRVSAVLSSQRNASKPLPGAKITVVACLACCVLLMGVPRFGLPTSPHLFGDPPRMIAAIKRMGLLTGLAAAATMSSPTDALGQGETNRSGEVVQTDAGSGLPRGMQNFSGMLIGEMVDRDIEHGSFSVKVEYVARVWENNKARTPRAVVGKQITVNGVTGKWLDELLLVRPGETVEFEAQHRGGEQLTFPGEWLKKVPAFDPADHPVPPEGFRGFSGIVTGTIIKKNQSSRELHLRIDAIEKPFEKNRANAAKNVLGKEIVLAGFWARMSKPFEKLEKGDRIRAGVLHRVPQSDHFTVIEMAENIGKAEQHSGNSASTDSSGFPAGMEGFRGILRGTLVRKDIEKGTLVFEADRATRTWKANRASDTGSCKGREFLVNGISGKWVDVLITLKPGDQIEVEAFHNSGEQLDFVAEWLKKVD
ncbi:MAG: M56 family metallopeptidase [Planctomycetota bacterium]